MLIKIFANSDTVAITVEGLIVLYYWGCSGEKQENDPKKQEKVFCNEFSFIFSLLNKTNTKKGKKMTEKWGKEENDKNRKQKKTKQKMAKQQRGSKCQRKMG